MTMLKIHRVNKSRYQVKNGKQVVRECLSYKEAMNAMISEDIRILDDMAEFCDTELEDMDLIFELQAVA